MAKKITEIIDLPGVGEKAAEKLNEAGFYDLMSIASSSPGQIVDVASIGESAAKKIINAARNNLDMGFMSGNELVEARKKIKKISTGSKAVDELVNGGFETGTLTGVHADAGCVDKDTEFLSEDGWKKISEYEEGDKVLQYKLNGTAEFVKPREYIKLKSSSLKLLTNNYGTNQCLSDEHRVLYYHKNEEPITKQLSEILKLHNSFRARFPGKYKTTFVPTSNISLNEKEIQTLAEGLINNEQDVEVNLYKINIVSLEMFYDHFEIYKEYTAKTEKNADYIQFILASNGVRATITETFEGDKKIYKIIKHEENKVPLLGSSKEEPQVKEFVPLDGYKYCFSVPSSYLVLRRDGKIFITGNSGKTAIAYQLAVNAIKPEDEGGLEGAVVWIDSEKSFIPDRVVEIAEHNGVDPVKALENIKYMRVYSTDHQMLAVDKVKELIKDGVNVKLIIVDSIMALFRVDYQARGELAVRQQKLNKHLSTLMKVADIYNICVYVTNQVMARPDSFFGDPRQAVGGFVLSHSLKTILFLRKGKQGSRVAKLVDSPILPDGETVFKITEKGIEDI